MDRFHYEPAVSSAYPDSGPTSSSGIRSPVSDTSDTFTSALKTNASSLNSLHRRRGSENTVVRVRQRKVSVDANPWDNEPGSSSSSNDPGSRSRSGHRRSRTDLGSRHHPLAGVAANQREAGEFRYGGPTRPGLSRMLSDEDVNVSTQELRSSESRESSPIPSTPPPEQERLVLVHQVSSKDSLPGIALKYGITLADIRTANQLWPSDPIYLRKTLYIPLDRSKNPDLLAALSHFRTDQEAEPAPHADVVPAALSMNDLPPNDTNVDAIQVKYPRSAFQRIPASRLTFFPPSNRSPSPDSSARSRSRMPSNTLPRSFYSASSPATSSPTPGRNTSSLASLFNALPLPIAARMSIDSVRSREASDDQEHELENVSSSATSAAASFDGDGGLSALLRTRSDRQPLRKRQARGASSSTSHPQPPSHIPPRVRGTVGNFQMFRPNTPPPLRTAQMEASPAMQIPLSTPRPRPKANGVDAKVFLYPNVHEPEG